jgi:ABC-type amino acid transport substrate-binding protein
MNSSVVGTTFIAAAAPSYFAFSRAAVTPDPVRRFDEAIEDMRKDGTLSAILSTYGLDGTVAVDIAE